MIGHVGVSFISRKNHPPHRIDHSIQLRFKLNEDVAELIVQAVLFYALRREQSTTPSHALLKDFLDMAPPHKPGPSVCNRIQLQTKQTGLCQAKRRCHGSTIFFLGRKYTLFALNNETKKYQKTIPKHDNPLKNLMLKTRKKQNYI